METPERSVKQLVSDLDFIHTEWGDAVHVEDVIRLLQTERQKREEVVGDRDRQLSYWLKHDVQCAVEFEAGDCDCGLKEALTHPNNPK